MCSGPDEDGEPSQRLRAKAHAAGRAVTGGSVTFRVSTIPVGDTLVLAAQQSGTSATVGLVLVNGEAPACLRSGSR